MKPAASLRIAASPTASGPQLSAFLGPLAVALEEAKEDIAERVAERVLTALARPERAALDRNELASALGISVSSLDRIRSERGFPEIRIGDAPRFVLRDVLDHLRAGSVGQASNVAGGERR